jgi:N-acetyl-alpha-D-glucosaminyl L-malate synthase BshA
VTDRLTIGVVCYSSLGGSGIVASELAAGLASRGHRVHVIASAPPSRPLPASECLVFHAVKVPDYPVFEDAPYELGVTAAIVEVGTRERLDVLHVHYAVPHAASAFLARRVLGAAAPCLLTTLHGTDVTHVAADAGHRATTRFTVAASDAVTVPSEFLRREAERVLELPAAVPVEVVPNFVDTDRFAPPERRDRRRLTELFEDAGGDAPILFHVSNFRPVKRVPDVIDVLALVRRDVPASLVLVGDGPERALAVERARARGVARSVAFLGKRAEFVDYLQHADVFVLPSESESFGVAALEALSAGVPVCGYRVGGLPEVVTDAVGELVAPFDVEALARAVRTVAEPSARRMLGDAARAHALAHFRRGPAIARYEALYRRLLTGRSAAR